MAYKRSDILSHLAIIQHHVPQAMSVTTDIVGNVVNQSQNSLTIQRTTGAKNLRLDLTPHAMHEGRTIERLVAATSLNKAAAEEIYWAGRELFKLNPRGSWCASTTDAPAKDFGTPESVTDLHPYVRECLTRLSRMVPAADLMICDSSTKKGQDGRPRKRQWIRFTKGDQYELAAIDTASISAHVADGFVPRPSEFLQANQLRMAAWAKQLEVSLDDLPEILHVAGFAAVQLGFEEVALQRA
jgi:hypothetical protein